MGKQPDVSLVHPTSVWPQVVAGVACSVPCITNRLLLRGRWRSLTANIVLIRGTCFHQRKPISFTLSWTSKETQNLGEIWVLHRVHNSSTRLNWLENKTLAMSSWSTSFCKLPLTLIAQPGPLLLVLLATK